MASDCSECPISDSFSLVLALCDVIERAYPNKVVMFGRNRKVDLEGEAVQGRDEQRGCKTQCKTNMDYYKL